MTQVQLLPRVTVEDALYGSLDTWADLPFRVHDLVEWRGARFEVLEVKRLFSGDVQVLVQPTGWMRRRRPPMSVPAVDLVGVRRINAR